MKKILFSIFIIILLFWFYSLLKTGIPIYSGKIKLTSLEQNVEVYFDEYGIPHIYAKNEEDAYKALGYVHAQERFFQLELIKRVMSGRLSEILGEEFIETDYFFKSLNTIKTAEESAKMYLNDTIHPYQKATMAYIEGINQYVKSDNLPLEFKLLGITKEEYTPKDIYLVSGFMAFGFAFGFKVDPVLEAVNQKFGTNYIKSLTLDNQKNGHYLPKKNIPDSSLTLLSSYINKITNSIPTPLWYGSNSWVIAPQLSSSGKVLIANDPHIKHSQPSVWYESHIEYPGNSFYGNFLVGIPFGVIGHTLHNAWGMTIFPYDDVDFYIEQFRDNKYLYNGKWIDATVRIDTINIKGKSDSIITLLETNHGPVIELENLSFNNNKKITVWWNYNKGKKSITKPLYQLQKNIEFSNVSNIVKDVNSLGINIMYGDSFGNIAWYACGKFPKRPKHVNSKLFLDGTTNKDEPIGYYNFKYNPKKENPDWGYLYSANNQPDTFKGVWHYGYFYPGYRGNRIEFLLEKNSKLNIDNMKKIQLDDISVYYPNDSKLMLNLVDKSNFETIHHEAFEILYNWNGNHNKNSIAPSIFNTFYFQILSELFLDELTQDQFESLLFAPVIKRSFPYILRDSSNIWWDNITTKVIENREEIISKSFYNCINLLLDKYGKNTSNWQWKKLLSVEYKHPFGTNFLLKKLFNSGPYQLSGGNDVLNKQQFILNEEGSYKVSSGPSARILIDFNDIKNSLSIIPSGQSGHPLSHYYKNQTKLYLEGKYRKQAMDEAYIIKTHTNKLVFHNN